MNIYLNSVNITLAPEVKKPNPELISPNILDLAKKSDIIMFHSYFYLELATPTLSFDGIILIDS